MIIINLRKLEIDVATPIATIGSAGSMSITAYRIGTWISVPVPYAII